MMEICLKKESDGEFGFRYFRDKHGCHWVDSDQMNMSALGTSVKMMKEQAEILTQDSPYALKNDLNTLINRIRTRIDA